MFSCRIVLHQFNFIVHNIIYTQNKSVVGEGMEIDVMITVKNSQHVAADSTIYKIL